MDIYTLLREFADSWALLVLVVFFLAVVFWAFRPGSRKVHDEISHLKSRCTSSAKPIMLALMVYGPPTRKPVNAYEPVSLVRAVFSVPDGTCSSVTSASIIGAPSSAAVTVPRKPPVVDCAYADGPPSHHSTPTRRAILVSIVVIRMVILS